MSELEAVKTQAEVLYELALKRASSLGITQEQIDAAKNYVPAWATAGESISPSRKLWDSFNTEVHPDSEALKSQLYDWLQSSKDTGKSFYLEGNCGTGKTLLAQAIAQAYPYIAKYSTTQDGLSQGAMLVNEVELCQKVKATWDMGQGEYDILNEMLYPQWLIFDDLGAYETRNAEWLRNIYYKVFDGRAEKGRPTLFISNLGLYDDSGMGCILDRIGHRNYDRLLGSIRLREDESNVLSPVISEYHSNLVDVPSMRSGMLANNVSTIQRPLLAP